LAYDDWDDNYRRTRKGGMHGSTVFLIAFFTSIATAAGTVYAIEKFDIMHKAPAPAAPEAIVPDLRGFLEADARANAAASHVTLLVASREPSAEVKPGAIIRQSIPAGQHVPRDHPMSVVLADELAKIPTVTGLSVVDASKKLEEKGYKLQASAPVANATVPEGQIVSQVPPGETPAEKGKTVTVQVSAGAGEVAVPKVMGLSINNAKTALEKVGLEAQVRWVSLAETPTYIVLNQKPRPNEKVKPGTKIEVVANQ
jgi:serine/threonine-protein kinase